MPTTLSTSNLVVTITEQLTSNGQILNYINQVTIPNIKPIDTRVMTIPTSEEVFIIEFNDDNVGAGQFVTSDVRYIRIINKDDTNWVRVRLKRNVTGIVSTGNSFSSGNGYTNGIYTNIEGLSGTGSGLLLNITVAGTVIKTLGTITPGSSYTDGTYTNVSLTGGAGSTAKATIVVAGNVVTTVTITDGGIGYAVGNVLSANAADIGGTGSGFSVPVATLSGVPSFTIANGGEGYTLGDIITVDNASIGGGIGFQITITALSTETAIADFKVAAGDPFIIGNTSLSVSDTDSSFSSFVNIQSISAQANTNPVDIEYFVASV